MARNVVEKVHKFDDIMMSSKVWSQKPLGSELILEITKKEAR